MELYPDTDDEMQWPPTAAYLPPRQCPATEFLESLMCPMMTSFVRAVRVLDLAAALPTLPVTPLTPSTDFTSRVSCRSDESDSHDEATDVAMTESTRTSKRSKKTAAVTSEVLQAAQLTGDLALRRARAMNCDAEPPKARWGLSVKPKSRAAGA